MQDNIRRLIAGATAIAVLAGGGAAYAAGSTSTAKVGGRGALLGAVTSYLGLSAQQLRADLASGETLAQIATAQGKSLGGLEQTIESAVKARLDQAVAAGKITASQEQTFLSRLQPRLQALVTTAHPGRLARHGMWRAGLIHVSASYLGLSRAQLRTELKAGKTLAQIANEHGKTAAGLEQAITKAVKARLDEAVSVGKLTSLQEQQLLNRLTSRLDTLVNRSFTR